MDYECRKFESGWMGLSITLSAEEIDRLIQRLEDLKSGRVGHFHFRTNDFSGDCGIADIEFSSDFEVGSNFTIE